MGRATRSAACVGACARASRGGGGHTRRSMGIRDTVGTTVWALQRGLCGLRWHACAPAPAIHLPAALPARAARSRGCRGPCRSPSCPSCSRWISQSQQNCRPALHTATAVSLNLHVARLLCERKLTEERVDLVAVALGHGHATAEAPLRHFVARCVMARVIAASGSPKLHALRVGPQPPIGDR
eukprot:417616-Prymnesium_polylepis.1